MTAQRFEIEWLSQEKDYDKIILACDIGGTKTDLGLVGVLGKQMDVICTKQVKSQGIKSVEELLDKFVESALDCDKRLKPSWCAISAAGPVEENHCQLTNCNFSVDGSAIENALNLQTHVMNDFVAMSFGVLAIDGNQGAGAIRVPHLDGVPEDVPKEVKESGGVKLVLGPGTGLGVSFIVPGENRFLPQSSEGGHITYAPFDEETERFVRFLTKERGMPPTGEQCISGPGIANIYRFLRSEKTFNVSSVIRKIDATEEARKPGIIAENCPGEPICFATMHLFGKLLGNYAANMAAVFLPFGGLYLTGGIVRKNAEYLIENHHFMGSFEDHPEAHIQKILREIPVYFVVEKDISLLGASFGVLQIAMSGW